jgi:hypothetical protein
VLSRLHILLAALWWGGTTALAFVAVPVLFMHFDTPAVAGAAAAKLFAAQSMLTLILTVVAALVLILESGQDQPGTSTRVLWVGGALFAISNQWWVAPLIVSARATGGNLALWHGLGSSLIVAQWLLALATLWLLTTPHKLKPN